MAQVKEKIESPEFLIEKVLPSREVHLLGGSSGAGKTRWLLKTLASWSRSEPVLGFPSHPVPYVYVSLDRSEASVIRTCEDIGVDHKTLPFLPLRDRIDEDTKLSPSLILKTVSKEFPAAKLIVIEGIARLVPGGRVIDYNTIADFLTRLGVWCQKRDATILGVHHTAKSKQDSWYENPREKLLGSGAWGGYSETILFLDLVSEDVTSKGRKLYILPRTRMANFTVNCFFDEAGRIVERGLVKGLMIERGPSADIDASVKGFIDARRNLGRSSFTLTEITGDLVPTLSRASLFRRLKELSDIGLLKSGKKGTYEIVDDSSYEQLTRAFLR